MGGRYNWKRFVDLMAAMMIALGGWITHEYVRYSCRKGASTRRRWTGSGGRPC